MFFLLVSYQQNKVHDLLADVRPEDHKLAIDSVHDGLQVVALPWIFRVKQLEQLNNECLGDMGGHDLGWDLGTHHELEEKLVHQLEVGPRPFEMRLIFIGVDLLSLLRVLVRKRSVHIPTYHIHRCFQDLLCQESVGGVLVV